MTQPATAATTAYSPRHLIRLAIATFKVTIGLVFYGCTRRTPAFAYQSMIRLFVLTGGRSNDLLSRLIGIIRRPYRLQGARGVLGALREDQLQRLVDRLRVRGYHKFDVKLPSELCDKLLNFALTQPCTPRARDSDQQPTCAQPVVYDRKNPGAIVYDFSPGDLINYVDIQRLMGDESIIALAQEYLGSKPVLDTVNMWWMTAYTNQPDSNAAQLYHFDMDHARWIKFFVYLTDVTPESGPHCFVAGSHRRDGIPAHLLSKGYTRLSDAEVSATFPPSDLLEITGPRGTILAVDTRGLHKGKPIVQGERLIFEMEFSNSLFGAFSPGRGEITNLHERGFSRFVKQHRRIYQRWIGPSTPL